jgi:integrase
VLVGNQEAGPSGSDSGGLFADLLEGARRRNLSANSLAAYERTWTRFLAYGGHELRSEEPSFPNCLGSLSVLGRREERCESQTNQGRAFLCLQALWDLKNPFAKIEPPLQKEPQIHYLLLADIRRLLDYLKVRQQGYGSALAFHLANALFQTACRFDELIQLTWSDCQRVGEEIVALRIKGKGSVLPGCAGAWAPGPGAARVERRPGDF